jgi:RHS repeat-associated protein
VQAFGNYRGAAPNQTITDRDFTGQPQNRAVGLLYYQARFYVPGIGRFASADTIVPNPANPQSFNRYSYVLNSPHTQIRLIFAHISHGFALEQLYRTAWAAGGERGLQRVGAVH